MDDSWEKEFHRSRKMFAVKDNTLYINTQKTDKSHSEWFREMGWIGNNEIEVLGQVLRGYVDSDGIYAYRGTDFGALETDEDLFLKYLPKVVGALEIDKGMPVYLGLIKGEIGEKFKPDKFIGTVSHKCKQGGRNMFVVTGIDTELNQKIEYEYESFAHALETYRSLKQDNTVENLSLLEYDLVTKMYHMVDLNP